MRHKIRYILLLLAMIPLWANAQSEGYNPDNPGDPQPPQPKYLVSVKADPSNAASFSISNERHPAGTILSIRAYPNTGFKMKQWVIGDSIVPNSTLLTYTVPAHASQIVAQFVYDPDSPINPGKNSWNPETGEVIVDDFTPGGLTSAVGQAIGSSSYDKVRKITVAATINDNDYDVLHYFSSCKLLDMSRVVGITAIPSYAFDLRDVESIYLPENIEKIGKQAFAYCRHLSTLMLYSTTPPEVAEDAFIEVCDTMAVYVPEQSLSLYQAHAVWSKLNLKTFTPAYSGIKLTGDIVFTTDSTYRFIHKNVEPAWRFTNPDYATLREGVDYYAIYTDNYYPGTATLTVVGTGDYTGKLKKQFEIEKGFLPSDQYRVELPDSTLTYDGKEHKARAYSNEGVGDILITYQREGEATSTATPPTDEGRYDVYMQIAAGKYYLGKEQEKIGSFEIYKMDEKEWQMLMALNETLAKMGKKDLWDMSGGVACVTQLRGVTVKSGHVTGLDLSYQQLKGDLPLSSLALPQLESLNVSHNELTGNLGLLGMTLKGLKSLDVSYNGFTDVVPMLPATITHLDISHQTIDRTITLDATHYDVKELIKQVPTILVYDHQNQSYNTSNLTCLLTTGSAPGWYDKWAVMLKYQNGKLSMPYVTTPAEYDGESGDTLHLVKLNNDWGNSMEGSNVKVKYIFAQGDANFKPGVDATDVQATVLYAFGDYTNLPFNYTAADTYKDSLINVQDVICTVNILLGDAVSQARSYKPQTSQARIMQSEEMAGEAYAATEDNEEAKARIYLRDGKVVLSTETPVAALCVKASGDIRWDLGVMGMEQATADASLVGYSLTHATLPSGESIIGSYTGSPQLIEASLSDPEAEAIPTVIGRGTSTAIKGIHISGATTEDGTTAEASRVETYNALGMKTSQMQKGINIVRKNGNIRKVINK